MRITPTGRITDDGFTREALLVVLDAAAPASDCKLTPDGRPRPAVNEERLLARFVRAFNDDAPTGYVLNLGRAAIEPEGDPDLWLPSSREIEDRVADAVTAAWNL
ncbi:hypothetical protein KGD82_16465 [Nocardiopsis eucommiae]|uniref:Uncharacterized protein n=1 Tax=Nocardiopsis eucommiae TaxID=2831970 RepID=A0A975L7J2_9ACTN|nr:hypothetical protein KGD82_16465 [Nocardiopsis eucommiae]